MDTLPMEISFLWRGFFFFNLKFWKFALQNTKFQFHNHLDHFKRNDLFVTGIFISVRNKHLLTSYECGDLL